MQSFEYCSPTEIIFGKGAENKAPEKIKKYGGTRVMLVYGGNSAKSSGLLDRVKDILTDGGLEFTEIGGVKPNPRLSLCYEGIKKALDFKADFFLALGGGSVIDTTKAIAIGVANPETDIWDFWSGKKTPECTMPMGSILTISAAGSETSDSAVITNEETGKKAGINTPLNRPEFAIMNPELTYTLPRYQIACGITDIIMHTLERYFAHEEDNHFTDRVAEELIKNVVKYGRAALISRKDYVAMSELMWCGSVSHNGFTGLGRSRDFAAHKLGHELSGRFDVAHGASLATMWPSWARYVYQDNPERFAQYAENVWGVNSGTAEERARAGIRMTEEFFKEIKMPTCFSELGIGVQDDAALGQLADMCTSGGTKKVAVFHPMDKADCLAIYKMANH